MANRALLGDAVFSSPIGNSKEAALASLQAGRSGIQALSAEAFGTTAFTGALIPTPTHVTTAPFHPRLSPRYNQILEEFCERLQVLLAGSGQVDRVYVVCKEPYYSNWKEANSQIFDDQLFLERIWQRSGLEIEHANIHNIQSACSSGLVAINLAIRDLESARFNQILIVGLETELNPERLLALKKLGAMSSERDPRRSCQPFSSYRSGLVAGEVAVAVLLRRQQSEDVKRGDVLLRSGLTNCDAYRVTDGLESGEFLERCLDGALHSWGVDDIDFVCPHGTSTPMNERIEGAVLERFFATRKSPIHVMPLKQYLGHGLDSSGLLETVLSAEMIRQDFLAPLLNADPQESYENLTFAQSGLKRPLKRAIKLSIGFGGINSSLLIEKAG